MYSIKKIKKFSRRIIKLLSDRRENQKKNFKNIKKNQKRKNQKK